MKYYKLSGQAKTLADVDLGSMSIIIGMPEEGDTPDIGHSNPVSFGNACNFLGISEKMCFPTGYDAVRCQSVFGGPDSKQIPYNQEIYAQPFKLIIASDRYITFESDANFYECLISYYINNSKVGAYRLSCPTYNAGDTNWRGFCIPNPDLTNFYVPEIQARVNTNLQITYSYASFVRQSYSTTFSPANIRIFFRDIADYDVDNPYADGGTSEEGKGHSNFSEDSDNVTVDPLPSLDAIGTGFSTLFTPSRSQLRDLSTVMWNGNVFAALQNLVENINGMFTSLAIVPFTVDAGATVEVTWFGLAITAINLTLATKQFYEFDMGSIDLMNDSRVFANGSALDYSPFSKLGIFLPFIGFQSLDIDECRDGIISLKYRIDILSGTCVALISVDGNCIYQFTGNCLTQIPITNQSMQSLVSDAVQVGIAAAATHSAKGAVASAGEEMSALTTESSKSAQKSAETHLRQAESHLAQSRSTLSSATANAAMGIKPDYGKTGAVSASAALLAVKQPYLFLTTPRQCIPAYYERYGGFPSNITGKLSEFKGLTVVEDIRLNGLVATSDEVAEIYQLLKEGVII